VPLAFRLQPENGSIIAAPAATLLSPAKRLTAPVPRSDPLTGPDPLTDRVPRSDPTSRPRGLAGCGTTIVTRVRRHHLSVRAPRGLLVADRFTLFALSHCETCKTTHSTEYRNSEEYPDHALTSIAEFLA
jgi:hypothetical protein